MARGEHLGEFEQVTLLAVARLEDGAYGMTIRREIQERTGRQVSIGAVYATLDRLVEKGLARASSHVRLKPEPAGAAARGRRFFELTKAGADALDRAREAQMHMWAGLNLRRALRRR